MPPPAVRPTSPASQAYSATASPRNPHRVRIALLLEKRIQHLRTKPIRLSGKRRNLLCQRSPHCPLHRIAEPRHDRPQTFPLRQPLDPILRRRFFPSRLTAAARRSVSRPINHTAAAPACRQIATRRRKCISITSTSRTSPNRCRTRRAPLPSPANSCRSTSRPAEQIQRRFHPPRHHAGNMHGLHVVAIRRHRRKLPQLRHQRIHVSTKPDLRRHASHPRILPDGPRIR